MSKKPLILLLVLNLLAPGLTRAQVYTPPTQTTGGGGGAAPGGGTNNTTVVGQPQQDTVSPIGQEIPFLDPESNTIEFNGQKFHVNNNQIFRARFEKYLNTAEASDEETLAYRKTIRDTLDILAPHTRYGQKGDKMRAALARMQQASSFEQDANLCESIVNAVYRMYLAEKNISALRDLNRQLDEERRKLDWTFRTVGPSPLAPQNGNSKGKGSSSSSSDPDNAPDSERSRLILRIAEKEAQRVKNFTAMEVSKAQAKLEFQGLIVQLFLQRRFEHVIMAARTYTEFFADGSGKLEFEEGSEVEETFSKSIGFTPTVTTLDAFSNEAIRDVKQQVESFLFLLDKGEVHAASTQLQQAFVTGEYLPSVQSIPRDKKREILGYSRNAFQLVNAISVKDYDLAETLIEEMKKQASDFDPAKPTAAVRTAKLTSNMKLRGAKTAMLKGDEKEFQKLLTEATKIWPTNPNIKTEFEGISNFTDRFLQTRIEFDRLLSTQSYRQIFTNQAEYMAATVDDPDRQAKLKQVLTNVGEIEMVLSQAESLKNAGNGYAAWEILERTFQKFPDDVPLSAKRSDYATDVAEFVQALKKAKTLEERGQKGSSLAWFLAARRIYPQSTNASEGIKRLVDAILPEGGGATPEATDQAGL